MVAICHLVGQTMIFDYEKQEFVKRPTTRVLWWG